MKRLYRCTQCYLLDRKDCLKPPVAFGVYASSDIVSKIVREGAWTRCLKCKATAEHCRIRNKLPNWESQYTSKQSLKAKLAKRRKAPDVLIANRYDLGAISTRQQGKIMTAIRKGSAIFAKGYSYVSNAKNGYRLQTSDCCKRSAKNAKTLSVRDVLKHYRKVVSLRRQFKII